MADLERGIPISSSTIFYAGSISKHFVAGCALLLSEQNKLDLDASVQKYLIDFPLYDDEVTVRHLIHHTSGIRDYFEILEDEGLDYLNQISPQKVYDLIRKQENLDFKPGSKYSYSNSGYLMLALMIEEVSGKPFSTFVKEEIFHRLGMHQSMFLDDNRTLVPNRAWGYNVLEDGRVENVLMRFDLVGSGGLYTSVEDLYLWDQNFYHSKIGSPTFLSKLLTPGTLNDGTDTGYAFALRVGDILGRHFIGHSGALGGYRAQYLRFPNENLSIIILGNFSTFKPMDYAQKIAAIVFGLE